MSQTTMSTTTMTEDIQNLAHEVYALYLARKERRTHPQGTFDREGRWYPESLGEERPCCQKIRPPSAKYPYSLLVHCRSLGHVASLFGLTIADVHRGVPKQPAALPEKVIRYKIVEVHEGVYRSLYDPEYTYQIGKTYRQAARENHQGGFYVHPRHITRQRWLSDSSRQDDKERPAPSPFEMYFLEGRLVSAHPIPHHEYAVLACECWGSRVKYAGSKEAYGHLRPIEVIAQFSAI